VTQPARGFKPAFASEPARAGSPSGAGLSYSHGNNRALSLCRAGW